MLHLAAFKNKFKSFGVIVKVANKRIEHYQFKEGIIKQWVDAFTNKDKFTALHYASFRGNVDIAQVLVEMGADIYL